jgi:hypothetical protein
MRIGPSGFCMPASNGCTVLRREAVFKKSPNPCGIPCRARFYPGSFLRPRAAGGCFDGFEPRRLRIIILPMKNAEFQHTHLRRLGQI